MRNKEQCRKCKWSGGKQDGMQTLFCNYASQNDHTCLQRKGSKIVDIRGNDKRNCLLFEEKR